jgi:hypothetical protein
VQQERVPANGSIKTHNTDDLSAIPVEILEVNSKPAGVKSKIGSEEFIKDFTKIIRSGSLWRTPKSLAEKLLVDPVDLAQWMDKQPPLCRKAGKEDGVVYYAATERIEKESDKRPPGLDRKVVTESDRYLVAELNLIFNNLHDVLEKHGLLAFERTEEGFKACVQARDRLNAGLALIANATGADVTKLPVTGKR